MPLGVCQAALCEKDLGVFSVLASLQKSWLVRPLTQNEDTRIQCGIVLPLAWDLPAQLKCLKLNGLGKK